MDLTCILHLAVLFVTYVHVAVCFVLFPVAYRCPNRIPQCCCEIYSALWLLRMAGTAIRAMPKNSCTAVGVMRILISVFISTIEI